MFEKVTFQLKFEFEPKTLCIHKPLLTERSKKSTVRSKLENKTIQLKSEAVFVIQC